MSNVDSPLKILQNTIVSSPRPLLITLFRFNKFRIVSKSSNLGNLPNEAEDNSIEKQINTLENKIAKLKIEKQNLYSKCQSIGFMSMKRHEYIIILK